MPKTKGRIRNYRAMQDEKLRRVYKELTSSDINTDAYFRCMTQGSGDPDRDIAEIEWLAEERCIEL